MSDPDGDAVETRLAAMGVVDDEDRAWVRAEVEHAAMVATTA